MCHGGGDCAYRDPGDDPCDATTTTPGRHFAAGATNVGFHALAVITPENEG